MRFAELLDKAVLPLLKEEGISVQYMHTVSVLKGFRLRPILGQYFDRIESDIVIRSIPQALVYSCRMRSRETN